jgi:hypothetical protein
MTLKEMLSRQACLDRIATEKKRAADEAAAEARAHEYRVHLRMQDEGFAEGDDIKHEGTRWGYQVDWYAKVQDPLAFATWAEEHAPHLVQPKPQKKLLNELVQRVHEDGGELPPGIAEDPKLWVSKRSV